jgi:hypothetical protein
MDVGSIDRLGAQERLDVGILLFKEGKEHVFGAHIVMIVVPALLLGSAEHPPGRRTETREQTCLLRTCEI